MKRIIYTVLAVIVAITTQAQNNETATEAVKNMGVGWNLGNTLDANNTKAADYTKDGYWGCQGLESENIWGQPTTKPELMTMMKQAGFGAIRVPVTWYNHMDKDGKVDARWMARVHEVVDYVLDAGMYCLLNVHHDTGAHESTWLKAGEEVYNIQKDRYEYLWRQIAEEFKDYDGKLLFESYNEMLDVKGSWCYASFAAPGGWDAAISSSAYNAINSYAQSFVNTVRAAGGKNSDRNLVVNTYAAACGTGNWNSHLQDPVKEMKLPVDNVEDHLIFEVHCYPSLTINNGKTDRPLNEVMKEVDETISTVNKYLVSKGAPVIIGEWGSNNNGSDGRMDYDARPELLMQFVDYFVQKTKENGIGTFHWMGLTDGLFRSAPAFSQPDLAERIVKAYHGEDFNGEYPTLDSSTIIFDGDKLLDWGQGITIPGNLIKDCGPTATVELTYSIEGNGDDLQLFLGDWSSMTSFLVDGKSFNGDFSPRQHYSSAVGAEHTTDISFSADAYNNIAQRGLIVHGHDIRLYKAMLKKQGADGIESIASSMHANGAPVYNLTGQRTAHPDRGLFIKNGKTFASY